MMSPGKKTAVVVGSTAAIGLVTAGIAWAFKKKKEAETASGRYKAAAEAAAARADAAGRAAQAAIAAANEAAGRAAAERQGRLAAEAAAGQAAAAAQQAQGAAAIAQDQARAFAAQAAAATDAAQRAALRAQADAAAARAQAAQAAAAEAGARAQAAAAAAREAAANEAQAAAEQARAAAEAQAATQTARTQAVNAQENGQAAVAARAVEAKADATQALIEDLERKRVAVAGAFQRLLDVVKGRNPGYSNQQVINAAAAHMRANQILLDKPNPRLAFWQLPLPEIERRAEAAVDLYAAKAPTKTAAKAVVKTEVPPEKLNPVKQAYERAIVAVVDAASQRGKTITVENALVPVTQYFAQFGIPSPNALTAASPFWANSAATIQQRAQAALNYTYQQIAAQTGIKQPGMSGASPVPFCTIA